MARTFSKINDRSSIRVLDVGCGTGSNLWFLAREGYSISGIDGSEEAIRKAKIRQVDEGLVGDSDKLDFSLGNCEVLPWLENTFDAVIHIEGLSGNKLDVIQNSVQDIHRVLKPGGVCFGKMFGAETTGWDTGEKLVDGTNVNPLVGPCTGLGYTVFLDRGGVSALFSQFSQIIVDRSYRSDLGGTLDIHEWLIAAWK